MGYTDAQHEEYDLVADWLNPDKVRFAAGFAGGIFAGIVAAIVGGLLATSRGFEFLFPVKLFGLVLVGIPATALGNTTGLIAGIIVFFGLCAFFGMFLAHAARTNHVGSLLAMGLVWAAFSWVFIWNLFLPAFNAIKAAQVSSAGALAVCVAYGLSLSSIAFFDRAFRGRPS